MVSESATYVLLGSGLFLSSSLAMIQVSKTARSAQGDSCLKNLLMDQSCLSCAVMIESLNDANRNGSDFLDLHNLSPLKLCVFFESLNLSC